MVSDLDTRYVLFAIWGGGTVLAYGRVLYVRTRSYWLHRDIRARREVLAGLALFFAALCSMIAILAALFGTPGTGERQAIMSFALGAFLAAGIIMATERRKERRR